MRISDWSSDVCSSDLRAAAGGLDEAARTGGATAQPAHRGEDLPRPPQVGAALASHRPVHRPSEGDHPGRPRSSDVFMTCPSSLIGRLLPAKGKLPMHRTECTKPGSQSRSEEHTSELQSLMSTSYAVFCLKK